MFKVQNGKVEVKLVTSEMVFKKLAFSHDHDKMALNLDNISCLVVSEMSSLCDKAVSEIYIHFTRELL